MPITVKHNKVSAIPDSGDDSLIEPSDWNADHTLIGLGTMAEQNANSVAITGGTISGVTLPASNITGTLGVPNGGTGATTLTGYVKGTGTTAMTASSTIPNTDITGLGTASTKDAGAANGVATLDAGGKVPVSELPAAVLGALNYQGTWNASTNTPTLTSSTGTKGYYYVVSVAGSTNLDGITDWLVGDWAVYNGTVWQKVDNTDAGGDVVGPASATDNAIARFDTTTGKLIQNSIVTVSDAGAISGVIQENFTPVTAPAYAEGRVFYDTDAKTLCYYNDNTQMTVNIGQENIVRVRNQTGANLTNGTVVYINGATGNTPTVAKAIATSFATADIIGVLTTNIADNGFGYATTTGLVNGIDTSAFTEGDAVFLSATTAGTFTATEPSRPNYSIQVGVILRANPSVGTLLVAIQVVSTENIHIIGTIAVNQGGTGQTTYTDGQLLIGNTTGNTLTKSTLTAGTAIGITNGAGSISIANTGVTSAVAGTGISVSGATGAVTVTNTAPDQTVVLTAGTGISTSGTYPSFTVTNTAPDQTVALASGTGISVTGTYPNFTVTNTAPSSGGTVTAVSVASANGFTGTSSGGATPALTLATSITGMLKGNGTAISAGTAGSDFVAPATATSFTAQQYFGNVALTDAATISWAASTAQVATFTFVSSNRTMGAPTGLVSGAYYGLAVLQNGGSNTLTWNSVFKWAGGTAPTLSTAAGARDYFVFRTDGTNMYEQGRSLGVA